MRFNQTYVDNEFKFLPFVGECSEINWKEKIIKNAKKQTLEDFQTKVVELIISNKDWNKETYSTFKMSLTRIQSKDLKHCITTILKTLSLSNEELLKELNRFSKTQDFYPFIERIKDKKTNKYSTFEKEICAEDSFMIIAELTKKVHSYISTEASKLLHCNEDIYISMDLVAELLDGKNLEFKEKLLKEFDKNFDYLKESPIFEDMYFNYREDYLNILLTALAYHVFRIRTGTTQNIDAYTYIKTKRTNKE